MDEIIIIANADLYQEKMGTVVEKSHVPFIIVFKFQRRQILHWHHLNNNRSCEYFPSVRCFYVLLLASSQFGPFLLLLHEWLLSLPFLSTNPLHDTYNKHLCVQNERAPIHSDTFVRAKHGRCDAK